MLILVFVLSALCIAFGETALIIEKTFPRDNAICYVNGKRLEVAVRGTNKYTEPREARFGQHIFYTLKGRKQFSVLPLSEAQIDTFTLFKGKDPFSLCQRAQGHLVGKKKFALLLLKENFPHPGKLVVQFFDAKTLRPLDYLETDYLSDKALGTINGFAHNSHQERLNVEMGKVKIEEIEHTYQDRAFPLWFEYDEKGSRLSPSLTYKKFPLIRFFKDNEDFNKAAGWNPKEKRFENSTIYLAVNHEKRRECLLLIKEKRKLEGTEDWRCRQL